MVRVKSEVDRERMAALTTEQRNPKTMEIDARDVREIIDIINDEDKLVAAAISEEKEHITAAVELVLESFRSGGRLIYVGAGTSGRLGVLDATECPPTFSADPVMVQGVIAGGMDALVRSIEGAEDYPADGMDAMLKMDVSSKDVVFGIATSGTTPYVIGALQKSRELGASTVFLTCNERHTLKVEADVIISLVVGPEVITGSTRMKAGTATKMVLNMVTTTAMIKLGKIYSNLMVDLKAWNNKLIDRACRIIGILTGLEYDDACDLLLRADKNLKVALVMQIGGLTYDESIKRLEEAGGVVRKAIGER